MKSLRFLIFIIIFSLILDSCREKDCADCMNCDYYLYTSYSESIISYCYTSIRISYKDDSLTCNERYSVINCMAGGLNYLINSSENIYTCSADEDCALANTKGEYNGERVEFDCFDFCPIAVNKQYKDVIIKQLAEYQKELNLFCYIPEDKDCYVNESYRCQEDIKNFYNHCLKNARKCEYHKVDCPYTKAVCNKEKGVCEGVKE